MVRPFCAASSLVALALAACSSAPVASGPTTSLQGTEPTKHAPSKSPAGTTSGDDDDDDGAPDASTSPNATTPISIATAWVNGFYGGGPQGAIQYNNTDIKGAPTGYYLQFAGVAGATSFGSVNDCSSFSDMLMRQAYGWTPTTTKSRALADDYYWAIRNGDHFTEITNVGDIQVGDVMALLFPTSDPDTGHVAWVSQLPQPISVDPVEPGTSQYLLNVIDSSNVLHEGASGPSADDDSRYLGDLANGAACTADADCVSLYGANATCSPTFTVHRVCALTGVGRGHDRLYVDATGTIQGFSLNPNKNSVYKARPNPLPTPARDFVGSDIVIGRYKP